MPVAFAAVLVRRSAARFSRSTIVASTRTRSGIGPAASPGSTSFLALRGALTTSAGFFAKLAHLRIVHRHAAQTMLGHVSFLLVVARFDRVALDPGPQPSLLWGWLIAGLLYTLRRRHRRASRLLPVSAVAARRVAHRRLARTLCLGRMCGQRRIRVALRAARAGSGPRPRRAPGQHQAGSGLLRLQQIDVPQRRRARRHPAERRASSSSATTAPRCSTTSTASAGRRIPRCGPRSTKKAPSEKARDTSFQLKIIACDATRSSARGCNAFRSSTPAPRGPSTRPTPRRFLRMRNDSGAPFAAPNVAAKAARSSTRMGAALSSDHRKRFEQRLKRLGLDRDAPAKRIVERQDQEEHQPD